jgi:hypothetical protein
VAIDASPWVLTHGPGIHSVSIFSRREATLDPSQERKEEPRDVLGDLG